MPPLLPPQVLLISQTSDTTGASLPLFIICWMHEFGSLEEEQSHTGSVDSSPAVPVRRQSPVDDMERELRTHKF